MARALNVARMALQPSRTRLLLQGLCCVNHAFSSSAQHPVRDLSGIFEKYPSKFDSTHTVASIIQEFSSIEDGARYTDDIVSVHGRITAKRDASNKLCFYDLTSDGATVQVRATARLLLRMPASRLYAGNGNEESLY